MISGFANEQARRRYHEVYDSVLDWPVPATDVTVPTSFGPTYLRRSGNTDQPPLVLLPGMSATSLSWQPHVAELSERHLVYAVDPIGEAGRSEQTAPMPDARAVAQWLAEVIAGLGHDRVHLLGISRGGWLALNQAAHSPDGIAGVTAVDPGGFATNGFRLQRYIYTGLLLMLAPRVIRRRIRPDSNYHPFTEEVSRRLVLAQLSFRMRAFVLGRFTEDELRAITVPTTVVLAERSIVQDATETQNLLHRVNPSIDVEILPGTAHNQAMLAQAITRYARHPRRPWCPEWSVLRPLNEADPPRTRRPRS
ncbi:alpha/beta fold hydrolase [Saccharothrix deserti]|uniref:alpha/beta fold hydrolase n=1 Tax=Saccharothrix deserti TaxID=2593674 RepID=UPI00131CECA7|nr:alpha/beta hydrolase [Saccharothrix deserti]